MMWNPSPSPMLTPQLAAAVPATYSEKKRELQVGLSPNLSSRDHSSSIPVQCAAVCPNEPPESHVPAAFALADITDVSVLGLLRADEHDDAHGRGLWSFPVEFSVRSEPALSS